MRASVKREGGARSRHKSNGYIIVYLILCISRKWVAFATSLMKSTKECRKPDSALEYGEGYQVKTRSRPGATTALGRRLLVSCFRQYICDYV